MSRKHRRFAPDDDGRTIAKMNVPGMPWHIESSRGLSWPGQKQQGMPNYSGPELTLERYDEGPKLTRRESRSLMFHALGWAFLYAGVYIVSMIVLILLYLN